LKLYSRIFRYVRFCFALAGVLGLSAEAQSQESAALALSRAQESRMVGYLPEWKIYSGFYPKNLVSNGSAEKLTHILYAFANVPPEKGTCQLGDAWADYETPVAATDSVDGVADGGWGTFRGNFNQLVKLKKLYPNLKVLISVGGWTWSGGFSAAASTDASRKALVSSCVKTFIEGQFTDPANYDVTVPGLFDGIDIDWEYAGACGNTCAYSPEDTQNFTLLLEEFRTQLEAESAKTHKHYLLSIAAPAGQADYSLIQLSKIHPYLDFVNLMTYDLNGGWNNYADHAAPLFTSPLDSIAADKHNNVDSAVSAYLAGGIPNGKLNVGIPFYGHGWMGVAATKHGLYQPATGPAPQDQGDYNVLQALPGFSHYYDPLSGMAHWIYSPASKTFYSYDDDTSVFVKGLYIGSRHLGGAMFWDLTGDDSKGTLVHSIYRALQ
jgi:chitinase